MASESTTSNVMLTGQSAYIKKNGTMTNHGVVYIDNINTSRSFTEGFIDEGSKIKAAKLEETTEYIQCETLMRETLLDEFLEPEEGEYSIEKNGNNIRDSIEPEATFIHDTVSGRITYLYRGIVNGNTSIEDINIPIDNFKINMTILPEYITDDNIIDTRDPYTIISNDNDFKILATDRGLVFNDISLNYINVFYTQQIDLEIIYNNRTLLIRINNQDKLELEEFELSDSRIFHLYNGFKGYIYGANIINLDTEDSLYALYPAFDNIETKVGMYNGITREIIECTGEDFDMLRAPDSRSTIANTTLYLYNSSSTISYFDTEYIPKANTKIVIDCYVYNNTANSYRAVFGCRNGGYTANSYNLFSRFNSSNVACYSRTGAENTGTMIYNKRITITTEGKTATITDGTTTNIITTTGTPNDCVNTMFLFGINTGGVGGKSFADLGYMRLFSCKIYEDGSLVRNYVPAKYTSNANSSSYKPALFDTVNKKFYFAQGTPSYMSVSYSWN